MLDAGASFVEKLKGLDEGAYIVIGGHIQPDCDCVGTSLMLASCLGRMGIAADVIMPNSGLPEDLSWLPSASIIKAPDAITGPIDCFISVDTSMPAKMGTAKPLWESATRKMRIDHHPRLWEQGWEHVDGTASSASAIAWQLMLDAGMEMTPEEATCAYAGLFGDTGGFRYQNSNAATLEAASNMANAGADTQLVARMISQNRSLASIRLMNQAIERLQFERNGQAVISWLDQQDLKEVESEPYDLEEVVDLMRSISGTEVAALLCSHGDYVSVRIRSRAQEDVSKIAANLGGRGNKYFAGYETQVPLQEAIVNLRKELSASR